MASLSSHIASELDSPASRSSQASASYVKSGGWMYPAAVLCAILLLLVGF